VKVRVVRAFIDRYTGKPYNPGYAFESDDLARIAELQSAGFLDGTPPTLVQAAVVKPEENTMYPKRLGGGWFLLADGRKVRKVVSDGPAGRC